MFQDVTPPREKKPYRSHFFTRTCSYVFYFFTRISSTTLKFTRELYHKDGKQIQIRYRYRYSRFDVTQLEKLDGMKKDVADTGKAAQNDIESVKNDVANQDKNSPSCSHLKYEICSSTDNPCGRLVRTLFDTDSTDGK